ALDCQSYIWVLLQIPRRIDLDPVRHSVFEVSVARIVGRGARHDVIINRKLHVRVPFEVPVLVYLNFSEYRLHAENQEVPVDQQRSVRNGDHCSYWRRHTCSPGRADPSRPVRMTCVFLLAGSSQHSRYEARGDPRGALASATYTSV